MKELEVFKTDKSLEVRGEHVVIAMKYGQSIVVQSTHPGAFINMHGLDPYLPGVAALPHTAIEELAAVLNRFIEALRDKIQLWHDIDDWFPELVEYKNSPKSDYETWQFLVKLCYQSEDLRFARKNSPYKDKFGKIRDRYHYGKKQIQAQLKETDFLKSKRTDDENER